MNDAARADRVDRALERAGRWLLGMRVAEPAGAFRTSPAHDPARWPGVLLPGTYDAILGLGVLGGLGLLGAGERAATAAFLLRHRRADGAFVNPQMRPEETWKRPGEGETAAYIAFHLTNYALGALDALGLLDGPERPVLAFAEPWLQPLVLEAWLARRDLRDPWLEGNNIVNLASFLLLMTRDPADPRQGAARRALDILLDWHVRNQEPTTGFWGVGQTLDAEHHLHAMAGATHNFHIYFELGAELGCAERILDYCLGLDPGVSTACLDVDPVDIVVHLDRLQPHRRADAHRWLAAKLEALLAFQDPSGGFADAREGVRRLDGWVRGYEEPQGLPNTFATFFRCTTIALVAEALWPERYRGRFGFRRMIGIGYRCPRAVP
jgi:hypothetical protein